jgi:Planctomycete cytochrome C
MRAFDVCSLKSILVRKTAFVILVMIALATCLGSKSALAQSADIKKVAKQLETAVGQAEKLHADKKEAECIEMVKKIVGGLQKMGATRDKKVAKLLQPAYDRLKTLHGELELQGNSLPALPKLVLGEGESLVSFSKQVAPILVKNCGGCHVDQARGRLSMANYESLMRGVNGNVVIFSGKADSPIVQKIEDGEMPPNGNKVPDEELRILKDWISAGAIYDGDDKTTNLRTLTGDAAATPMPRAEVSRSTGKETVSFSFDLAPVIVQNCGGCHLGMNNLRGGLNMNTFQQLIRGGDSGPLFVAKDPATSQLIKRLKGDGVDRMPAGRDALPTDVIAKFEKWIEEGATFDGDANLNMSRVAEMAKASRASHEQMTQTRLASSLKSWELGMPSTKPQQYSSDNFILIGNMDEAELKKISEVAESLVPKLARVLKFSTRDPLIKGKMTLFVFKKRYDYSEFGQMVEARQLPKEWQSHWRYNVVDAYGAILLPENLEEDLAPLLEKQIAGVQVSSWGSDVPYWFAEGIARATMARMEKKSAAVSQWEGQLGSIVSQMTNANDFMTGKMSPEEAEIAAFGFADYLLKNPKNISSLQSLLKKGASFEQAFGSVFKATPKQAAAVWSNKPAN